MALRMIQASSDTQPEPSPAVELLDSIGLTDGLPEMLIQDQVGRGFEPVQISPQGDLVQQLALLLRREPVGGAENQIHENSRRIRARVIDQLNRALASAHCPPRTLLGDLLSETRLRKGRQEQHMQQLERAAARTQTRLHRWQDHAGQRSGSLGGDMWRWLVGSGEHLSLPQVVALWNEREYQALDHAALAEASAIFSWFLDIAADLLARLDDLVAQVQQLRAAIVQQHDRLQGTAAGTPWTVAITAHVIAQALADQADPESLVAEVLRAQATPGSATDLAVHMRVATCSAAERLLAGLGVADLIEIEARAAGVADGVDPVIAVGEELLATLARPTWQIVRSARPRVETLQVVSSVPIFSEDGLSTALYGVGPDRLAFVRVQLGVAKDDLLVLRDGDEAFQTALQYRNVFVLEELAQAWEAEHAIIGLPDSPPEATQVQLVSARADTPTP